MKRFVILIYSITSILSLRAQSPIESGFAPVNGIKLFYQIYGKGKPLVLIPGGGSTIETSFGRVIPMLALHHKVIAIELQAHGRTNDRDRELSFVQDADDVVGLLNYLKIDKADFFGFSNGATTTLQIAIRHPKVVNKIVLGSPLSKRNGVPIQFWDFMKQAKLANMPQELKDAYIKVAADSIGLQKMHDRDVKRMLDFKDIPDEEMKSITAPALVIVGDKDVITIEHALEMHRLLPGSALAVIPGVHGEYIEEVTTLKFNSHQADFVIPMIVNFLNKPLGTSNDILEN